MTVAMRDLVGARCLVTGATGFVGRRLVARLRAGGAFVRGLARTPAASEADELVLADLAQLPADAPVLDRIDVLFHLAAKTHDVTESAGAEAEYRRVNVEGTTRLLAARAAGLRRVVFVSSVKAVNEGNTEGHARAVDESTEPRPLTPYGRSKLEAERVVRQWAASHGVESVCLRFPLVYGPGQLGNLQRMIHAIERRRFPTPPRNSNRRSMLHVDNAVDALLLAGWHAAAAGHLYFVTDARAYSTREVYDAIRAALGRSPARVAVPETAFRALALAGDLVRRVAGRRVGFDSDAYQKLLGSAEYRTDRITRDLGYQPRHDLFAALPALLAHSGGSQ